MTLTKIYRKNTASLYFFIILFLFFNEIQASSWCCSNSIDIDDSLSISFENIIKKKYSKEYESDSLKEIFLSRQENFKDLMIFDSISLVLDKNPNNFWEVWRICLEFLKEERTMLDDKIKIADLFFIMIEKMRLKKISYAPLEKQIFKIHELSLNTRYISQADKDKLSEYTKCLNLFKYIN